MQRVRLHLGAVSCYLLAGAIYTFPLCLHPTTQFPNSGTDVYGFIWNNWWIQYAITVLHTKPYVTDFAFVPFSVDLRLHTLGLLYGLFSIPIFSVVGPIGILNAQIMTTIVLNGYSTFTLTTALTKSAASGFIAGLLIAATPAINFHVGVGRPSCAALWPAIFAMLLFLQLIDRPAWPTAAGLAVSLIAVMMADQQSALFCAGWLMILLGCLVVTRREDVLTLRLVARVVLVGVLVWMPAYLLYWKPFARTAGYTVPAATEALTYSYPLRLLWTPAMIWNVYGVVMPVSLVAGMGLIRRLPSLIPWALGSTLFVALSLGPVATGTGVPLPFSIVQALPGFAQFRTPYRFQIPAAIGLAVMVGILVSSALERVGPAWRRSLVAAMLILIVADLSIHRIADGFSIGTLPREPVYERIAGDTRHCVLLEVPVGVRTGTDRIGPGEALSFYQPVHKKRLINGFAARAPLAALNYYRTSPAIMFLAHETPPAGDIAQDFRRRLRELNVCYVVVHPELMETAWLAQAMDLLNGVDSLRRLDTSGGAVAFRVEMGDR